MRGRQSKAPRPLAYPRRIFGSEVLIAGNPQPFEYQFNKGTNVVGIQQMLATRVLGV